MQCAQLQSADVSIELVSFTCTAEETKLWCGNMGEHMKCRQHVVMKRLKISAGLHPKGLTFIAVCPAICTYILKCPTWFLASHFPTKHLKTSQTSSSSSLLHYFPRSFPTYSFRRYENVRPGYINQELTSENFGTTDNRHSILNCRNNYRKDFCTSKSTQMYKKEYVRSIPPWVLHA
jgi:hypothetical protein